MLDMPVLLRYLPALEEMLMIRPALRDRIAGRTARQNRNWLLKHSARVASQSLSGPSIPPSPTAPPTLLTRMSIPPQRRHVSSTTPATSSACVASAIKVRSSFELAAQSPWMVPSASALMSTKAVRAPSERKASPMARPIPDAAPVTMAFLPCNLIIAHALRNPPAAIHVKDGAGDVAAGRPGKKGDHRCDLVGFSGPPQRDLGQKRLLFALRQACVRLGVNPANPAMRNGIDPDPPGRELECQLAGLADERSLECGLANPAAAVRPAAEPCRAITSEARQDINDPTSLDPAHSGSGRTSELQGHCQGCGNVRFAISSRPCPDDGDIQRLAGTLTGSSHHAKAGRCELQGSRVVQRILWSLDQRNLLPGSLVGAHHDRAPRRRILARNWVARSCDGRSKNREGRSCSRITP